MNEEWKSVPSLSGVEASTLGNIKLNGRIRNLSLTGKGYKIGHGYLATRISGRLMKAHRLVAMAFHPNPTELPQTNHKNGITTDNRPENLEWCDGSHNIRHALRTGLMVSLRGSDIGTSVLTDEIARSIFDAVRVHGKHQRAVAREFGISQFTVCSIANRESWRHATPDIGRLHEKGVTMRGEFNGRAKLTEESVRLILRAVSVEHITQRQAAQMFGVSQRVVWSIVHGKIWKHITLAISPPDYPT